MHPMYIGGPMMKDANSLGRRKRVPNGTYYDALVRPNGAHMAYGGTHGPKRHAQVLDGTRHDGCDACVPQGASTGGACTTLRGITGLWRDSSRWAPCCHEYYSCELDIILVSNK
jgi:hypothetical protein